MSQLNPYGGFYATGGAVGGRADGDDTPVALAEALDATIDAAGDALDAGDVDQAKSLLDSADVTSDALIAALGGTDADEAD